MSSSRVIRSTGREGEREFLISTVSPVQLRELAPLQETASGAGVGGRTSELNRALDGVRREAQSILSDARAEAERLRQQGYEDGFAAGQTAARLEVEQACADERAAARADAEKIRAAADEQWKSGLVTMQGVMADLVMEAIESLLHTPGVVARADVVACVAELMESEVSGEHVQLRMHPADVDASGGYARLERIADVTLSVKPDEALTRGGFVVETEAEEIDATLETRLGMLQPSVQRAVGRVFDERNLGVPDGSQGQPAVPRVRPSQ